MPFMGKVNEKLDWQFTIITTPICGRLMLVFSAYEVKIGTGSISCCHFGDFWFLTRLLWAVQSQYLGPYLRFWP